MTDADIDPAATIARRAADRLAYETDPRLPADVEAELHATSDLPDRYFDPVSIASLIVAIASLAWTIHKDLRAQHAAPTPQLLARRIRIELDNQKPTELPAATRDQIIDVIVDEALTALPPPDDTPRPA